MCVDDALVLIVFGDCICSSTVEEYMVEIERLARQLLELLTEGLGLEPTRFNHYVDEDRMMSMRFNLYPPCPQPELAIGLRAHTDPHLLTILHQDEIAGLQVHIDDEWVTVKPRPDCFVINIGDLFQVSISASFADFVEVKRIIILQTLRLFVFFVINIGDLFQVGILFHLHALGNTVMG